ncbi:tight junction-associated protein 1-like [Chrysemys picta bellii]|uniref:tight junction-associated protein 1-like n=1 Tax=Chrysemys picta bellii TaxID=8478 RepID=UPI001C66DA85|nr:tight junction-associated protein 1-like [Chrysemys picta bellii]
MEGCRQRGACSSKIQQGSRPAVLAQMDPGPSSSHSSQVQGSGMTRHLGLRFPTASALCDPRLPRDHGVEQAEGAGAGAKSGPAGQQDLQQTWEELELLKEKFSRLQEDYSNTQRTNQLLEEKLHLIAQSMAAEKQTLNQHITELLERLISAQNTICTLERLNISMLLSESAGKHRHMEKASSADSLYSLHISDVAPPPAFMDSASDAHTTTPSQSDSATEANKPDCSSESDTAMPNGDRTPVPNYHSLPSPGQLESHGRTTAFTPWKQQCPGELLEHVNSTESECSAEEGAQVHALPMPHFLYLRQEALVAPSVPTVPPTDALRPPSPQGLLLGGRLELVPVPELSSTDSSDGDEAWSQGLGEKEPGVSLDYQSAQKILDSLLRQHQHLEKEPAKASGGGYQDRSEMGQAKGHQRRIRYYWDFQSPGKEQPLLHQPQHGGGSLPRAKGEKVLQREQECGDGVMDSTLL